MEQQATDSKPATLWVCENCDTKYIVFTPADANQFWMEGKSNCCGSIRWSMWKISMTRAELFKLRLRNDITVCMDGIKKLERIA